MVRPDVKDLLLPVMLADMSPGHRYIAQCSQCEYQTIPVGVYSVPDCSLKKAFVEDLKKP